MSTNISQNAAFYQQNPPPMHDYGNTDQENMANLINSVHLKQKANDDSDMSKFLFFLSLLEKLVL